MILWDNLRSVSDLVNTHNLPWIVMGDFNEVLEQQEKFGGKIVKLKHVCEFRRCLNDRNLID